MCGEEMDAEAVPGDAMVVRLFMSPYSMLHRLSGPVTPLAVAVGILCTGETLGRCRVAKQSLQ